MGRRGEDCKGLNRRRVRFAELYVFGPPPVRFNATRAAAAVGYAWPGKQGPRLLTVPGVAWLVDVIFKIRYEVARHPDGRPKMKRKRRECM